MSDFKKLIGARFLFSVAVNTQAVIVGWRMYALTHEPLHLGLIGLSEAVPALGIAVFAGYVVDHSRPVLIYRNVILGSLISAALVFISQSGVVSWTEGAQILALYVASFLSGAARGFAQPAMFAIVPNLLPRANLARASAWMSTAMQTAGTLGPALGGLVFGYCGMLTAAALPVVCLLLAAGAWATVRTEVPAPLRRGTTGRREELLSGARFVFKHPILLPALTLDMLSVLFGGVEALLPIFASDILMVGPRGLGALRAAPALGSALVSFGLTRLDIRARAGRYLLGAVFGFGLCIVTFGLSRNYWLSLAVLSLSGMFDGVSMIIRSTAVQLVSPAHLRGRISAINSIFIGSSNELGEFESGVVAHLCGTVPAVLLGGVACLGTVTLITLRSKALRELHLGQLEDALQ